MMKYLKIISLILVVLILGGCSSPFTILESRGDIAYDHIVHITQEIGGRASFSDKEIETATYIQDKCEEMGYETEWQTFKASSRGGESQNIIATKEGRLDREIVIGAHYDSVINPSVDGLRGANDNAGGVGVVLEAMEYFKDIETEYTLTFILFGAEEMGLEGSRYYVSQLAEEEIDRIEVMINMDVILAGDYMYVYGNEDERGKYRDRVLEVGQKAGLDIITQEGENPLYPRGTTVPASDHAPFDEVGVPIVMFAGGNWTLADKTPYVETTVDGKPTLILHTEYDNVDFMNDYFPGRIDERLNTYTNLLINVIEHSGYVFDFEE